MIQHGPLKRCLVHPAQVLAAARPSGRRCAARRPAWRVTSVTTTPSARPDVRPFVQARQTAVGGAPSPSAVRRSAIRSMLSIVPVRRRCEGECGHEMPTPCRRTIMPSSSSRRSSQRGPRCRAVKASAGSMAAGRPACRPSSIKRRNAWLVCATADGHRPGCEPRMRLTCDFALAGGCKMSDSRIIQLDASQVQSPQVLTVETRSTRKAKINIIPCAPFFRIAMPAGELTRIRPAGAGH